MFVQLFRFIMELDSQLSIKHWKTSKILQKIHLLLVKSIATKFVVKVVGTTEGHRQRTLIKSRKVDDVLTLCFSVHLQF